METKRKVIEVTEITSDIEAGLLDFKCEHHLKDFLGSILTNYPEMHFDIVVNCEADSFLAEYASNGIKPTEFPGSMAINNKAITYNTRNFFTAFPPIGVATATIIAVFNAKNSDDIRVFVTPDRDDASKDTITNEIEKCIRKTVNTKSPKKKALPRPIMLREKTGNFIVRVPINSLVHEKRHYRTIGTNVGEFNLEDTPRKVKKIRLPIVDGKEYTTMRDYFEHLQADCNYKIATGFKV